MDEAGRIKEIARHGKDPLSGPLRLGVIYTIGPYLLPALVRQLLKDAPQMPLLLTENFTVKLVDLLKNGEIDVAIMALPLPEAGLVLQPVYDEPFVVAVPRLHPWSKRKAIPSEDLKKETMLLLGPDIASAIRCSKCARSYRASRHRPKGFRRPSKDRRWKRSGIWWAPALA